MKKVVEEKIKKGRELYDTFEVCNPAQERMNEYPFLEGPVRVCAENRGQLIDAGCGRGYWFPVYQDWGVNKEQILGLDSSIRAIESIISRGYSGLHTDLTAISALPGDCANLCVATGSLMHTYDTRIAFDECCRLVKPGGELVVNLYNVYHPYFWLIHKCTYFLRHFFHNQYRIWWWPFAIFFQLQNFGRRKKWLNQKDLEAVFFDQVMTPYAHLHSMRSVKTWFANNHFSVKESGYNLAYAMFWIRGIKNSE